MAKQIDNKTLVKEAKMNFVNTMKKKYPDFSEKKWAGEAYRANHPQGVTR